MLRIERKDREKLVRVITLKLPDSMTDALRIVAEIKGWSLNQLCIYCIGRSLQGEFHKDDFYCSFKPNRDPMIQQKFKVLRRGKAWEAKKSIEEWKKSKRPSLPKKTK